jgi:hypothetical protein
LLRISATGRYYIPGPLVVWCLFFSMVDVCMDLMWFLSFHNWNDKLRNKNGCVRQVMEKPRLYSPFWNNKKMYPSYVLKNNKVFGDVKFKQWFIGSFCSPQNVSCNWFNEPIKLSFV